MDPELYPDLDQELPIYPRGSGAMVYIQTWIRNYPEQYLHELYKEKEGCYNKYMYFIYFFTASSITSTYIMTEEVKKQTSG
jgi:hypothetical protein